MKTLYPTFYRVSFWDEETKKNIIQQGVMFAASPADATTQLEQYYGAREIDSFSVYMLEENYVLELPLETWKSLFEQAGGIDTLNQ